MHHSVVISYALGSLSKPWQGDGIDDEPTLQEAVASFQPTSQDLDYPSKLQHLAEQPESAVASAETEQRPLTGAAVANGDSSSLVSMVNYIILQGPSMPSAAWLQAQQTSKC